MKASTGLLAAAVVALTTAQPSAAQEDARIVPVFNARHEVSDVLVSALNKDKALVVVLHSGTSYSGKIKDVGDHAVILTELRGKEFYDAWIPFSAIVALEERVRLR